MAPHRERPLAPPLAQLVLATLLVAGGAYLRLGLQFLKVPSGIARFVFLVMVTVLAAEAPAMAYLDRGAGSMLL